MFTLIFSEQREPELGLLKEIFAGDEGVSFSSDQLSDFIRRPDLDALIVTRWLASDRYHEIPSVGISKAINTKGDRYFPPHVVTTPGFPAHIVPGNVGNGVVVRDPPILGPVQEAFVVFSKVFQAIQEFNEASNSRRIQVLGCNLEFIGMPLAHEEAVIRQELQSIHRAYLSYVESSES